VDFAIYAQHVAASDLVLDVPGEGGPGPTFALEGARPNPSRGDFAVAFSLPDATPATLELIDLLGRRLREIAVGGLGPGPRVVRLGAGARLNPGIYWLRLTRAGLTLAKRAIVLP